MYVHDGGGGAVPTGQSCTGQQRLRIEPTAIPAALAAFREAHDRVSRKAEELAGLRVSDWASDPVSGETAAQFVERTNGSGADSAYECLLGYERQLATVIESLELSEQRYLAMEGTNAARWGKYD